jgi:transposase
MAYSLDIRKRVVEAVVEDGMSRRASARRFKVSESAAIKWVEHFEATGRIEPDPPPETHRSRLNDEKAWLLELIVLEPDLTLEEIVKRLAARDVDVCPSAVWRFFDRNAISFKKNGTRQRAGQARRGRSPRRLAA